MTTKKENADKSNGAPGSIHGTTDARAFTNRLRVLARHMEKRTAVPILNCATLEFGPMETFAVSYYGVDFGMTAEIEGTGTGSIALPLQTLLAFVDNAGGDTVEFSKGEDDPAVTVKCGPASATLTPITAEGRLVHMPTDPQSPSVGGIQARDFHFGEGVLRHLAGFCMPFVSTEETRYYLNGVCFEFGDSVVRTVATDGHKLGVRETKTTAAVEEWKCRPIVPRITMAAILDVMGDAQGVGVFEAVHIPEHEKEVQAANGPVKHTIREQWDVPRARFTGNGWVVTSKLIDGNFPEWRRVVPKFEGQSIVTMKAAPLIRLARMSKGMRGKGGGVAVKLETDTLDAITAKMRSPDFGTAEIRIDATLSAPLASGHIGLNVGYLAGIAKAMGTPEICMYVQGHGDPMIITAPGEVGGDFAVLMPMRT